MTLLNDEDVCTIFLVGNVLELKLNRRAPRRGNIYDGL